MNISESFAHLIDGYHRMLTSSYKDKLNNLSNIWRFDMDERPMSPQMLTNIPALTSPILKKKEPENSNRIKSLINGEDFRNLPLTLPIYSPYVPITNKIKDFEEGDYAYSMSLFFKL